MKADRQVRVQGTLAICHHNTLEDIRTYGETIIGRRCTACGLVWGVAYCVGCKKERYCLVVSADGTERFCTQDCRQQTISARAQSMAPPARSRSVRGRR